MVKTNESLPSVSIVIPMYNAAKHIVDVLQAIFGQDYKGHSEVIVVNDGSKDSSFELIKDFEKTEKIRIINQTNLGAVTATNNGFKAARYDIICSIDADVILYHDWLSKVIEEFDDPLVGAVQGYYRTPRGVTFWARMMGYDVEARYDSISSKYVTQVCTGNTAYRKVALEMTGPFDKAFTYGYDNDMSYRLQKAGYRLVFKKTALCDHYWKSDFMGYIRQQYRSAYGRMQLINKHNDKIAGDSVSGIRMILQVPLTLLFFVCVVIGLFLIMMNQSGKHFFLLAFVVLGMTVLDRFIFAFRVFRKKKDLSAFYLPLVHLLRNNVWSWAFLKWVMEMKWIR